MADDTTDNKREFARIVRRFVLRVAVDDGNLWPKWSLVTTHNLSAGGALFIFDQPVKEGQGLHCRLHFVEREVECKARVIRCTHGFQKPLVEVAVAFEWATESDRVFVADFTRNIR